MTPSTGKLLLRNATRYSPTRREDLYLSFLQHECIWNFQLNIYWYNVGKLVWVWWELILDLATGWMGPTWAKCRRGGSGHLDCTGSAQITGNQMGATHPPLLLHGLGFRPRHSELFGFYQTSVTQNRRWFKDASGSATWPYEIWIQATQCLMVLFMFKSNDQSAASVQKANLFLISRCLQRAAADTLVEGQSYILILSLIHVF